MGLPVIVELERFFYVSINHSPRTRFAGLPNRTSIAAIVYKKV